MRTPPTALLLSLGLALGAGCSDASAKGGGDGARFDKKMRRKGCELLTADVVASTFGVPASELKQIKVMGCTYSWEKGDEVLEAALTSIYTTKSEKSGKRWFKNATKNKTAAEVKADMAEVKKRFREKMKEREKKSGKKTTATEKKAADSIGNAITDAAGPGGYQYEDVSGIGDEARISENDGTLTVRVDNMIFNVRAYKGEKMPPVKPDGTGLAALKALGKKTMKAQRAFVKKTLDTRKAQAKKLAAVIVKKL